MMLIIHSPFPPEVGFASASKDELDLYSLHREELRHLSPKATKKRRMEYQLGRMAASRAFEALGISPQPVKKGIHREPLWPEGLVGSISHKDDLAVAAVARKTFTAGIGLDLERIDASLNVRISNKVCTPSERDWIFEVHEESQTRLKMLFSAKEAGFKAFFPIWQIFLGYLDAELCWCDKDQCFRGVLLKSAGQDYPVGYRFEVYSRVVAGFILSSIVLSPRLTPQASR